MKPTNSDPDPWLANVRADMDEWLRQERLYCICVDILDPYCPWCNEEIPE